MLFGEVPTNSILKDYGGFVFSTSSVGGGGGGGSQTLANTLSYGNTTGGNDIQLSSGDSITSTIGLVNINDPLNVVGDTTINGKLTVTGLIDPTGLVLDEQIIVPFDPTATTQGTLWVKDDNPNTLYYTDNNGTDHNLIINDIPLSGTVSTVGVVTDNVVVYTMLDNTAVTLEVTITGRKDDGTEACGFRLIGTFRRSGGVVTQVGNVAALFYESDDNTWNTDIIINSTDLEVRVTGGVGDNIDWKCVGKAILNA